MRNGLTAHRWPATAHVNLWLVCVLCLSFSVGYRSAQSADASKAPIKVATRPFRAAVACTGAFVAHPLDHITTVEGQVVQLFDSNGSGLAINDLNSDGNLDIVMGNLAGTNTIFWNEGNLRFHKEPLTVGNTRAVNIVDVDGDGWLDLVFTHQLTAPTWWRNQIPYHRNTNKRQAFIQKPLRGVDKIQYNDLGRSRSRW